MDDVKMDSGAPSPSEAFDIDAPANTQPDTEPALEDTTPKEQQTNPEVLQDGETDDNAAADFSLDVKFNHELRSLQKDEAVKYAQMGLAYEAEAAARSKLDLLAAAGGYKSRNAFIDMLTGQYERYIADKAHRQAAGDPELEKNLIDLMKEKNNALHRQMQKDQELEAQQAHKAQVERIADEFLDLQKTFPDYKVFDDLPGAVVQLSLKEKVPLKYALLQYNHLQGQKEKQTNTARQKAKQASAGSAGSGGVDENARFDALMSGIWGRR